MLIALTSGKAAPGVTTTAWALSLAWPRPLLVVDGDPAGGDMTAGLLLGRLRADHGVLSWTSASRRASPDEAASALAGHVVGLPEAPNVWLLPGFQHAGQASVADASGVERLAVALGQQSRAGRDVLVDLGRLGAESWWPVIAAADRVVVVCRCSGRSIHAARNATSLLRSRLGDLDAARLLVIEADGPYDAASIASELQVKLLGQLAADRFAAAVLSDGAASARGIGRSKLLKMAREVAAGMTSEYPLPVAAEALR